MAIVKNAARKCAEHENGAPGSALAKTVEIDLDFIERKLLLDAAQVVLSRRPAEGKNGRAASGNLESVYLFATVRKLLGHEEVDRFQEGMKQSIVERTTAWEKAGRPGAQPSVPLSEQRGENRAFPLPEGVFLLLQKAILAMEWDLTWADLIVALSRKFGIQAEWPGIRVPGDSCSSNKD